MSKENRLSIDQVPGEVRFYMGALQPHLAQPFVQKHFRQITCLKMISPSQEEVDFFALEFHISLEAALIWTDGDDQWAAGSWLPIPHPDADISSPPSALSIAYFQQAIRYPSIAVAIEALLESD